MSEAPELLPCPFCGGDALLFRHPTLFRAVCCEVPDCGANAMAASVPDWNRRADLPPALSDALALPEIAALVGALEWIKRRKPDDIRSDGGMHAPHRGHGEAAFDMWGCAYAALSALRAAREKE